MPRPKKNRFVYEPPLHREFRAVNATSRKKPITLSLDEYEAFRLADHEGLSHEQAAQEMDVSRSTFTRLIEYARKKIADMFITGKTLQIEGGNVHFRKNVIRCMDCRYMFKINFDIKLSSCPECYSDNLLNLAGGFGHGDCCREYGNEVV